VYMAAAMVPGAATAMATSSLPLALIPARVAPHMKPAGTVPAVTDASLLIGLLYQALREDAIDTVDR
jgi:hypothetical protein